MQHSSEGKIWTSAKTQCCGEQKFKTSWLSKNETSVFFQILKVVYTKPRHYEISLLLNFMYSWTNFIFLGSKGKKMFELILKRKIWIPFDYFYRLGKDIKLYPLSITW